MVGYTEVIQDGHRKFDRKQEVRRPSPLAKSTKLDPSAKFQGVYLWHLSLASFTPLWFGSACSSSERKEFAVPHRVHFAASSLTPQDPAATAPRASLLWLRYNRASVLVGRPLHTALRSDWFITCNRSLCFPWVQHLHSCVCKVADVA